MPYCKAAGREVTDLEMMQNPEWWPVVCLPLMNRTVREGGWGLPGILIESGADRKAGEESIYLFFAGQSMYESLDTMKAQWLKIDWLDRLIEAGWRVD